MCITDLVYFCRHPIMHMGLVLSVDSISIINFDSTFIINCKFWARFMGVWYVKKTKIQKQVSSIHRELLSHSLIHVQYDNNCKYICILHSIIVCFLIAVETTEKIVPRRKAPPPPMRPQSQVSKCIFFSLVIGKLAISVQELKVLQEKLCFC